MISPDAANPYRAAIQRVYQAVDRGTGALLEAAGPGAIVMLVSDCGVGPLRAGVQLNTWLSNEGFLRWIEAAAFGGGAPGPKGGRLKAAARRILPAPAYRAAGRLKRLLTPAAIGRKVGRWPQGRVFRRGGTRTHRCSTLCRPACGFSASRCRPASTAGAWWGERFRMPAAPRRSRAYSMPKVNSA